MWEACSHLWALHLRAEQQGRWEGIKMTELVGLNIHWKFKNWHTDKTSAVFVQLLTPSFSSIQGKQNVNRSVDIIRITCHQSNEQPSATVKVFYNLCFACCGIVYLIWVSNVFPRCIFIWVKLQSAADTVWYTPMALTKFCRSPSSHTLRGWNGSLPTPWLYEHRFLSHFSLWPWLASPLFPNYSRVDCKCFFFSSMPTVSGDIPAIGTSNS